MRRTGYKRGRSGSSNSYTRKPKAKRVRTTSGALVTQSRVFIPRSFGNPMAYGENKYFDAERTIADLTVIAGATWASCEVDPTAIGALFAPTQGTGFNNREGRKVWVKKIKVKGFINWGFNTGLTAGDEGNLIRMLLLVDKQTNAIQFNSEDVLESGGATANPTISAYQNPAFFGRFIILKDKTWGKGVRTVSWDGTNMEEFGKRIPFKWNINFKKPMVVHFNATNGGTVADIVDNSFHIMAAQYKDETGGNSVNYKSRVVYCE